VCGDTLSHHISYVSRFKIAAMHANICAEVYIRKTNTQP
jgi:hypothetical protein